ncbi:6-phospho-3-hexuloisomerase [Gracilibacillus sp. S3-1-1]|uniref:6-phospho-3-hexuloisomerase n=1 Tax=Gracilibacillus pellucidus TaxID=3095368 RepID=A0ACC6M0D4_9BACI|nr:6-phospho-3-hexuloisomerase [Gracilibacillus sp. S3-1-1]MDX8044390.1 6-phospho-3-hexuloisomerase [Gracilibacillus sp. S3-1-1]
MATTSFMLKVVEELQRTADQMKEQDTEKIVETIIEANKIFVAGTGRSGFMGKSFAMRLMHMNYNVYVVGETITPAIEKNDLLIVGSGSGETGSLLTMVEKARSVGATVLLVTTSAESSIGKVADMTVTIPAKAKAEGDNQDITIQPMGSLFEQALLLFYDSLVLSLMEKKTLQGSRMFGQHANLE